MGRLGGGDELKRLWFTIVGVAVLILMCIGFIIGFKDSRWVDGTASQKERSSDGMDLPKSINQKSVSRVNSGQTALKNACGLFGEVLFDKIQNGNYEEIYRLINQDVLYRYGYTCYNETMDTYWQRLSELAPADARMMLYDISSSDLTKGEVLATYCIAGPIEGAVDLEAFNYNGSLWVTITVYFNDHGEITSMLPCPEASIDSYAAVMGFVKENDLSLE